MNLSTRPASAPSPVPEPRRRPRRPRRPRRLAGALLVGGAMLAGTAPSSAVAVTPTERDGTIPNGTARAADTRPSDEDGARTPEIRAGDIAPFEVVYDVGNNLITAGIANLSFLRQDGGGWIYTLATKPTGVFKLTGRGRIRETSVLDVVRNGETVRLQPRSYSYRQDDEKSRSVDAAFDWEAGELSWKHRGEEATEPFAGPLLDRLSVTLAVMNLLRGGFEELELEVFDSGQIKTMRFVNEGLETLDTTRGKVETIRVRGENAAGSSRSSMTWFAPSLDYVPVRIEQRKRDELVARMNLMRLKNRVTEIELADPDELGEPAQALPLEE